MSSSRCNCSILFLRITFFAIVLLMGVNPSQAYDVQIDGIYYNVDKSSKTAEVTYESSTYYRSYSDEVIIPRSITHDGIMYLVTSIGDYAFRYCSTGFWQWGEDKENLPNSLTSVSIPSSVTSIGKNAFENCHYLSTVSIPNSVLTIKDYAFSGCHYMSSLQLSNAVESIGKYAFEGCAGISSVIIPNTVKSIGQNAFCNCEQLKNVKSEILSPFEISNKVFVNISSDAILQVPKGTINKYRALSGWTSNFNEITEYYDNLCTLSITSFYGGCVSYLNSTIEGDETQSFSVEEGTYISISITPYDGYRIKALYVDGTEISFSQSGGVLKHEIDSDISISVEFEIIPPQFVLNVEVVGGEGGYIVYNGPHSTNLNRIVDRSWSYSVDEGSDIPLVFTPKEGYVLKNVTVNDIDVTSKIINNRYTISNINVKTCVKATFESTHQGVYILRIKSSEGGSVIYSGNTISNDDKTFAILETTSITFSFTPNSGYKIGSLWVNNVDVTSYIDNNTYTISNINKDITVEVIFEKINMSLTYNGVNYRITSYDNGTVNVASGSYGQLLKVPASFYVDGKTWQVKGMDSGVITSNPQLAAVIWGPSVKFDASTYNPNFLLYVTSADYAPSTIKNVIVNGTANSITLTEATSGNNFYCPEAFTARSISYAHNYMMTTGIGESQGWETIALPFDVQTITHSTKGEIIPFAKWSSGASRRPFWLYELTSSGWREASAIKAYTPYIISMPNNDRYYDEARLNGNVTFSATNVRVEPTSAKTAIYQGKTFTPNFTTTSASASIYALNVKNQWTQNTNSQKDGSTFVQNLRTLHPFEAYMSSENSTRSSFPIFEDMTTGIRGIADLIDMKRIEGVYNLKGQKVKVEVGGNLPAGIYIINGQKVIVK